METHGAAGSLRHASLRVEIARAGAFFLATILGGYLGRLTYLSEIQVVLVSPFAGLGFLWLASGSRRSWWWDIPALSVAQVLTVLISEGPPAQLVTAALVSPLQPVVMVLLMRRLTPDLWGCGGTRAMTTLWELVRFVVVCAFSALIPVAVRAHGLGLLPPLDAVGLSMVWVRSFSWALAIGVLGLLAAPALTAMRGVDDVRAAASRAVAERRLQVVEAVLVFAVTAGMYVLATQLPVPFAIILVTVWAALRLPPVVAALQGLTSGVLALLLVLRDAEFFAAADTPVRAAALAQTYMIVLVVTSVAVSLTTRARLVATTRAVAAERAAADKTRVLDAAVEHLREGVVVLQAGGPELLRNPAGRAILDLEPGRPYDEAMPGPEFGLFDADGRRYSADELPHALALSGVPSPVRDFWVRAPRHPDGMILEISATPLAPDTPGAPPRAVVNFRDVTKEREERDALASFAGVVAHDLNSPLSVVRGWSEALRLEFGKGPVTSELGLSLLERVERAAEGMAHLITDLLAFTIAKDQPLRLADVDLTGLVEQVAANHRDGDIGARIAVQPGMTVRADPALLLQVVDNLISNATKYVAPDVQPDVGATGEPDGELLRIAIADNGIGVPPTMRRRIFESFQRAHGGDYPGTGLGLAICRRVVERHGGTMSVHDNPAGTGSEFVLTLPMTVAAPAAGNGVLERRDEPQPHPPWSDRV